MAEEDKSAPGTAPSYLDTARVDVVRGSLWSALTSLVTLPVAFVGSVIVARSLDAQGFGQLAALILIFRVGSLAANAGWSEASVQWLAAASARGHEDERAFLIRACQGFHLAVTGPISAVIAGILLWPYGGLGLALCGGIAVFLTQACGSSLVILTSAARNALSAQLALVAMLLTQVALAITAIVSQAPGPTWVVQLVFALVSPVLAVKTLRDHERRALLRPLLTFRMPRGFFPYAASACVGGLVTALVFGRSEILVLQANGLIAQAGVFVVVTQIAGQMTAPLDSLLAPLTPLAAGLVATDRQRAIRSLERALRVSASLGGAAAAVLLPIVVIIVEPLYGGDFKNAAGPLVVLGLVSCIHTITGPLLAFAFATRSAPQVLRANLVCLATDGIVAIVAIPLVGIWGAVLAAVVAQLLSVALVAKIVRRRVDVGWGQILRPCNSAVGGLVIGSAISGAYVIVGQPFGWVAAPVVAAIAACLLIAAMRWIPTFSIHESDLSFVQAGTRARVVQRIARVAASLGVVRP